MNEYFVVIRAMGNENRLRENIWIQQAILPSMWKKKDHQRAQGRSLKQNVFLVCLKGIELQKKVMC